jgi:pimeloyl-ACP methyl ester carboxylesterase
MSRFAKAWYQLTVSQSGAAAVLVHGGASNSRQWKALAAALEDDFVVIAPDLYRADGTPAWGGTGSYRLEDAARFIIQHCLGFERVNLVGHSLGGAVAMEAAAQLGERVGRLVLLEPAAYPLLRNEPVYDQVASLCARTAESACRGDWMAVAEGFFRAFLGDQAWEAMPQERRERSARNTAYDWQALLGSERTLQDWKRLLPERTLVLSTPDTWAPLRAVMALLRASCLSWAFVELPGGGHMAPLTRPELVNPLVVDFLTA